MLTGIEIEERSPASRIAGTLLYRADGDTHAGAGLLFTYGSAGYSVARLVVN